MLCRATRINILQLCLLVVATSSSLLASGTTGILKGKIVDISTNEPLPLVNVALVGSGRGAVTNDKGEYSIVGVTPGSYTLRVSLLGYRTIEGRKALIEADETTVLDFKLASEDIEMEGVTVEGQRPLVDVTKTAGDQTYNRDKIEQLPNVKGAADVIGLQAGVVKFGSQLFLRGGRANETQILVDGVAVNDVTGRTGTAGTSTANEQLQQLYSGAATGGGGALSVAASAIQSVSVSSSGLDAEFGNAQSGVVNITTRSGGDAFSGSVQYRTDGITNGGFNERYYSANIGGPEPITSNLLPALGVDVPGKLTFFMSSTFNQADGPYRFNTSQYYTPLQRKVRFAGFFGRLLNNAGFAYSDKQDNEYSFNTKLSYSIGDNDQFAFSYRANASSSRPITGGFASTNLYDSTSNTTTLTTQNVLLWTHILGTNSLIKAHLSRLETQRLSTVANLDPSQYSSVGSGFRDPNQDGFNDFGTAQGWSNSNTVVWNFKADYNSQIHEFHFLKTGMEYYYEHLQSTAISFPLSPDPLLQDGRGLWNGYGKGRWVTNSLPSRGALYAQDNIELTGINIHIGLRYDFLYLGKQVFDPSFVNRWASVTGDVPGWVDNYNFANGTFTARSFGYAFTHGSFSPRLSIGYPISERTVFYFNYGHFLQYPERDQLFHDPVDASVDGNYVGNPALKPQKTVQYEAGFDQLIFDDLSLGIRGYYKDVFDYATLNTVGVDRYVNLDYASTRGFEVIVTKQLTNRYSGSIGYTFQLAKGRSSDPFAVQAQPNLAGLPRETRLDYDQQHTLNLFLGYRVGPKEQYDVLGLNINNWGASVTWNFGSGFPYTPYNAGRTLADVYLKNTGDGPYTSELNISLYKGFSFIDHLNMIFTLDVTNVLNRKNVDMNAGGFNSLFGRPLAYGDYAADTRHVYTWTGQEGTSGGSFYSRIPPFIFRPPRQISLGMKINWD